MEVLHEIGRVRKSFHQDVRISVTSYRNHPFVTLETLASGAEVAEDPQRPRIVSFSPQTVKDLLPLLAEAQAFAAKFDDEEEAGH